ncbi:hypothetical protein Q7P37_003716 [Cladosporium fusiforme]
MADRDEEKHQYAVHNNDGSPDRRPSITGLGKDSVAVGEAAALYGDVKTAEKYGYVARGLKSRHIQFIAIGGTIGTGLFLGIGSAFVRAGPLSVLLGYTFTGIAIFGMMHSLTLCAEISAAAIVIGFWNDEINQAAWITLILVLIVCLNIFAVSIYGEAEFIFASIKIITIIGLLILAFIIDLGGGSEQGRLGFRYWKSPWAAMKEYVGTGDTGRFAGLFSTLVNAAFSYGGVEMVCVAAGEAEDPRRNIPKAVRRVFWRIMFFYVLGSLAIGAIVPADDDRLLNGGAGAASSPWVIAIVRAGIPVLPHIINAVILTSASSSGNAFLYSGSRYLFALAQNDQAPKFFLKCTKKGVPVWCVLATASVGLLTYMDSKAIVLTVSKGSNNVFNWFQTLTTITSLFTWVSILIAFLRFRAACHAQGVTDKDKPFVSRFQPYTAWFSLIYFIIIIVFCGWKVFTHEATTGESNWAIEDFVTSYIVVPVYLGLYIFWKVIKRTRFVKSSEADIWTGKAALDAEEWPPNIPRNTIERIWYWIA